MNITGKWLTRFGALAILLGYVIPTMAVSCSGIPGYGQSFSLLDLAGEADQSLLYLVPLASIMILVLTVLPTIGNIYASRYLVFQLISLVLSLLSIFIVMSSLNSQISNLGGFEMNPEFGLYVLILGYIITGIGIWLQWSETSGAIYKEYEPSIQPSLVQGQYPNYQVPFPALPSPRLELIHGNLPKSSLALTGNDLSIGRSADNSFILSGSNISRYHARLRHAEGDWFIQDQGSKCGTFVNGQLVQAQRLSTRR